MVRLDARSIQEVGSGGSLAAGSRAGMRLAAHNGEVQDVRQKLDEGRVGSNLGQRTTQLGVQSAHEDHARTHCS
jgi:hypothetical protein